MKTSGLVILSNQEKMGYPWRESITSFLPVVDEMVCVHNPLSDDGSRAMLEEFARDKKQIRIVSAPFDLLRYGWISYGIMRTVGYQACRGDIVVMFDADGVLHEKEAPRTLEQLKWFDTATEYVLGYWGKYRLYKPFTGWLQNKHSGIYHKGRLGDRFDFWRVDGGEVKGAPNVSLLYPNERSIQFDARLFGYEHFWDSEETMRFKINSYGQMIDRQHGRPVKTPEEYFKNYIEELKADLEKKGEVFTFTHPAIMQDKVNSINETHFAHSFFGWL